jgi:hypothetical protein
MYHKLPVSSLESRALNNDPRAIAELHARANNGLRRATLALERIAGNKPRTNPVNTPATPKLTTPQSTCNHTHYDFDCPTCVSHWNKSFEPLIAEQRGQVERTAQQIFDENRGK